MSDPKEQYLDKFFSKNGEEPTVEELLIRAYRKWKYGLDPEVLSAYGLYILNNRFIRDMTTNVPIVSASECGLCDNYECHECPLTKCNKEWSDWRNLGLRQPMIDLITSACNTYGIDVSSINE